MSLLDFGSDVVSVAVGVAAGYVLARRRRPKLKPGVNVCPWFGCGFPVPTGPLVFWKQNGSKSVKWAAAERCEGCDKPIMWDWETCHFLRVRPDPVPPPEVKPNAGGPS